MAATPPQDAPRRTLRLAPSAGRPDPAAADTDYDFDPPAAVRPDWIDAGPPAAPGRPAGQTLDRDGRDLFRWRLGLCCVLAAVPFVFFVTCAATNFIDLFGRQTVGTAGLALGAVTVAALAAAAGGLFGVPGWDEQSLRVTEITVFGLMAVFFAYWQFMVLTATPVERYEGPGHMQSAVVAAAVVVHFNWFVLIVFHGVLVPNTLARGVGITVGMGLAAVLIDAVAVAIHPPTRLNAGPVSAVAVTLLAAAGGLAVFGTAKTAALEHQVRVARQAVRELGQYRLKRKLGQGGMGEVYLAEHYLLKRPCALKRINPKYLNNLEQVKRFEREVQATARLRHPNTVEIYDYGRADDGTFYYVMEYLPGLSLEDLVGRYGPQPADRVVHILRQVCGALAEAHRHGLVHRDIKPSNVLLLPDGNPADQAKVLDFGLVHSAAAEEPADRAARITREGLIVGTPEYMSPEQASGGALDARSDLFSLGSVAYFLLTGKEVFHRDNPMKTLLAVVHDGPPPLVEFAPGLPDDLRRVVKQCLAKAPADRPAGAAEVGDLLAACACAGGWTAARSADWWAAHPADVADLGTDLSTLPLAADDAPPAGRRRRR